MHFGGWKVKFTYNNSLPIWEQLVKQLKEYIVTGQYPAGGGFPPVRELAAEAGVNPNTMQRALVRLEEEGLLITNRTAGRTVTDDLEVLEKIRKSLARECTKQYLADLHALGYSAKDAEDFIKEG